MPATVWIKAGAAAFAAPDAEAKPREKKKRKDRRNIARTIVILREPKHSPRGDIANMQGRPLRRRAEDPNGSLRDMRAFFRILVLSVSRMVDAAANAVLVNCPTRP